MVYLIMRKFLFLIVVLFVSLNMYSADKQYKSRTLYGRYGLLLQKSNKDYLQYVGKEFIYLPEKLNTEDNEYRKLALVSGQEYVVESIKASGEGTLKIFYFEKGDIWKTRKLSLNKKDIDSLFYKLPIYFTHLVEDELLEAKGKLLANANAENKFEIVDVKFEEFNSTSSVPSIVYYVKDIKSGIIHRISDMSINYADLPRRLFEHRNLAQLISVDSPFNLENKYDGIKKAITNDSLSFTFSDNNISGLIVVGLTYFYIGITNKYPNSIKIMWNEASFADTEGFTSQIMHEGIKYNEREKLQTPTTIISQAHLLDIVLPIKNAKWDEHAAEWIHFPLFDTSTPILEPKTMKLMIPIQINGVVNEYLFTFVVKDSFVFPGVINKGETEPVVPNLQEKNYLFPLFLQK